MIDCTIVSSIINVIVRIVFQWHHYRKSWKLLINTKDDTTDSRFTADQISHFFDTMPEEFDEIMRLYFPGETQS